MLYSCGKRKYYSYGECTRRKTIHFQFNPFPTLTQPRHSLLYSSHSNKQTINININSFCMSMCTHSLWKTTHVKVIISCWWSSVLKQHTKVIHNSYDYIATLTIFNDNSVFPKTIIMLILSVCLFFSTFVTCNIITMYT